MAVRTCTHCHKSHRIVSGDSPVCRSCGHPYQATTPAKAKTKPGWGFILLGMSAMFLLIAVPGYLVSRHAEETFGPPSSETALEYKVRKDKEHEEAEKQRAVQETLERIRQRQ